jgi:hypothetical protein
MVEMELIRMPVNLSFKDPLVRGSDDWDFPTNKFPGIGWLGRVHRGTPWQTVYPQGHQHFGRAKFCRPDRPQHLG